MGWFKLPQATPALSTPQAVPQRSASGPGKGVPERPLLQQTEEPLSLSLPSLPSAAPQRPLSSSSRHRAWAPHGSQTPHSLQSLWRRAQDSILLPGRTRWAGGDVYRVTTLVVELGPPGSPKKCLPLVGPRNKQVESCSPPPHPHEGVQDFSRGSWRHFDHLTRKEKPPAPDHQLC